jgi:hypothetical protein
MSPSRLGGGTMRQALTRFVPPLHGNGWEPHEFRTPPARLALDTARKPRTGARNHLAGLLTAAGARLQPSGVDVFGWPSPDSGLATTPDGHTGRVVRSAVCASAAVRITNRLAPRGIAKVPLLQPLAAAGSPSRCSDFRVPS